MHLKKLKPVVPYILVFLIFCFYLLTIPHFVKLLTPCLQKIPGQVYEHSECVITLALDRFMIFSLVGFAASVLYLFFTVHPRSFKRIIFVATIMAIVIILAYLHYIPESELALKNAQIVIYSPK